MFFLNIMSKLSFSKLIRPIGDTTCVRLIWNLIMIIIEFIIWTLLKQKLKNNEIYFNCN